jgi:hypothetical protein
MSDIQQLIKAIDHLETVAKICDDKSEEEIAYLIRECISDLKKCQKNQKLNTKKFLLGGLLLLNKCVSEDN